MAGALTNQQYVCKTPLYAAGVATGVRMGHHRGATDHGSGRTPGPRRHPYESVKGVPTVSNTFNLPLAQVDPEVAEALALELGRQRGGGAVASETELVVST